MAPAKPQVVGSPVELTIAPPNFGVAEFGIVGDAPYVQNKFSAKAKAKIRETQEAGSTSRKGKKKEPKDFEAAWRDATHVSTEGWYGIPAASIRNAMISACRVAGFQMTRGKLSVFVLPDGFDDEGTALVRITKGEPDKFDIDKSLHTVRLETGVCDLRARPMWPPGWEATVRIRFDADQFTVMDVSNLLLRAGMQVGIGEGRPDSKKSCGQGWGLFSFNGNGGGK